MKDLRRNSTDSYGCCSTESEKDFTPIKKNCDSKGCKPINVKPDLDNAVTIPMIGYKIFDCISLEDKQFRFDPNVIFYIEDGCYCPGDSICVEKVRVDYDFIGLQDECLLAKIDAQTIKFKASTDSIFDCDDDMELYDEYTATVKEKTNPNNICKQDTIKRGIKSTIFHRDLEFFVSNLKITVSGKIGCKPFIASTCPYTGSLSDDSLDDYDYWAPSFRKTDLYGKICLPKGAKKVSITEDFKAAFCVDCISTTDVYECVDGEKSSFTASLEYCLLIQDSISSIIKEKLLVVTTPGTKICHDGNITVCQCLDCDTSTATYERSVLNQRDEYIPSFEEYTEIEDDSL